MNHHGVKLTAEGVHSLKRCQEQGTLCTLAWQQALWVCFTSRSCICVVSLPSIPGATTENEQFVSEEKRKVIIREMAQKYKNKELNKWQDVLFVYMPNSS